MYTSKSCVIYHGIGIGEAGKSTFIKQMRIIHGGGFSEEEKKDYRQQIHGNVYIAIQNLTRAMRKLKVSFDTPENEVSVVW